MFGYRCHRKSEQLFRVRMKISAGASAGDLRNPNSPSILCTAVNSHKEKSATSVKSAAGLESVLNFSAIAAATWDFVSAFAIIVS